MKRSKQAVITALLMVGCVPMAHAVFSAVVPEPSTMSLLVAGGAGAAAVRFLRKRNKRR